MGNEAYLDNPNSRCVVQLRVQVNTRRQLKDLMKKLLLAFLFILLPWASYGLDVPALRGHINDYAEMLSPSQQQQLETQLTEFERTDSTQIVVLTIPSLAGENLEDFSIRVAEAWKIGQKNVDNGAILLIARDDRKIRIEVGRGLEGKLTDLISGRIIRGVIAPRFKAGDFAGGITDGVTAIMDKVRGEYEAPASDLRHGNEAAPPILTMIFFLAVLCVFLGAMSRILAGLSGAVGLPFIVALNYPSLASTILVGLGVLGLVAGLALASLFGPGRRGRGFGSGPFSGGYFGGGFGGGGGSSSGGGFSGGGGSFGGGGASGDW